MGKHAKTKKELVAMIVDDLVLGRHFVRAALTRHGVVQVVEASDGINALQILRERETLGHPIDLIVCDLNMPRMNGLEFLREVRSKKQYKNLTFIAVTVESDPSILKQLIDDGATEYFIKPLLSPAIDTKLGEIIKKICHADPDHSSS